MIQISTPTQTPTLENSAPAGSLRESGGAESFHGVWGNTRGSAAHRKNSSGFFARLLEGLVAKGKRGAETGGAADNGEEAAAAGVSGKNVLKTAKTDKKSGGDELSGVEIPGGEGNLAALFAMLRNDAAESSSEPGVTGAETGEPRSARGVKETVAKNAAASIAGAKNGAAETQAARYSDGAGTPGSAETGDVPPDKELLLGFARRNGMDPAETADGNTDANNAGRERYGTPDFSGRFSLDSALAAEARFLAQRDGAEAGAEHGEAAGASRETEGGSSRSRKNRFNVDFRDMRTGNGEAGGTETADTVQNSVFDAAGPQNAEAEILVDLKLPEGREAGWKATGEAPAARSFEDALAAQLRGSLSTDIVQNATIIARNGGEGLIRLSLRPASLGDVKIRLELTDNKITGLIIVESDEALRAFERELPVLEKAFKDSGFSETNLEMSLAQDGWNSGARDQRGGEDFSGLAPVIAASRYDAESEQAGPFDSAAARDGAVLSAAPGNTTGRAPVNLLI